MSSVKQIQNFLIQKILENSESFSHEVNVAKKKNPSSKINPAKYDHSWYIKKVEDEDSAIQEVIAQEFFRLLLPTHPKTRFARGVSPDDCYVLSKEITGFTKLEEDAYKTKVHFRTNTYKGLGSIMVLALVTEETDLKYDNIALDDKNNLIKYDGGWCFNRLKNHLTAANNYQITEMDINKLPFLDKRFAFNWLDAINEGIKNEAPLSIDHELSNNPHFRNDVNEMMLKLILLPEHLIREFVAAYIPNDKPKGYGDKIINELTGNIRQLKSAALANESFQKYLAGENPQKIAEQLITQVKNFVTTGKNQLKCDHLESSIAVNLTGLLKENSENINKMKKEISPQQVFNDLTKEIIDKLNSFANSDEIGNPKGRNKYKPDTDSEGHKARKATAQEVIASIKNNKFSDVKTFLEEINKLIKNENLTKESLSEKNPDKNTQSKIRFVECLEAINKFCLEKTSSLQSSQVSNNTYQPKC